MKIIILFLVSIISLAVKADVFNGIRLSEPCSSVIEKETLAGSEVHILSDSEIFSFTQFQGFKTSAAYKCDAEYLVKMISWITHMDSQAMAEDNFSQARTAIEEELEVEFVKVKMGSGEHNELLATCKDGGILHLSLSKNSENSSLTTSWSLPVAEGDCKNLTSRLTE